MKKITLQIPNSDEQLNLEVSVEEFNHQQSWRIKFDDGRTALLGVDQHRIWTQFDGDDLDSGLITKIGETIESEGA